MTTQVRRRSASLSRERGRLERQWTRQDDAGLTAQPRDFTPASRPADGGAGGEDERSAPPAHVLVVEDEESFVDALTVNLEREGFSVSAARAPYWPKVVALEDIWLCNSATALAIGGGATSVPRRQPVIE